MFTFNNKFRKCFKDGDLNPFFVSALVKQLDRLQNLLVTKLPTHTIHMVYTCRDGSVDQFLFTPKATMTDVFNPANTVRVHSMGGILRQGGEITKVKETHGEKNAKCSEVYSDNPKDVVILFIDILAYKYNHLRGVIALLEKEMAYLRTGFPTIYLGEAAKAVYSKQHRKFVLTGNGQADGLPMKKEDIIQVLYRQIDEIEQTMNALILVSNF